MLLVRSDTSTPAELPRFALTDLPNELLNMILQSLHSDDLLLIACSCTRLNHIALCLFFQSVDFHPEDPESSLNIGVHPKQPFTILKGIRLCVTLRALHTLRCRFSDQSLMDEMEEILDLLILLPAVSSIHLIFPSVQSDYQYYSMSRFLESFTLWKSETDPRWLAFAKVLLALLNVLHEKGCIRLEIAGLTPPSSLKSGGRRVPLRATNTLREVIISTGHTLSGKLLDWVVQSVESSPVQTLRLTTYHLFDLTPLTILSRVNLPHLTDFHICISAQLGDIAPCLRRNPNLRSLRVVLWSHHASVKIELDMCPLPHLTHLAAVPKFVIDFLSLPHSFPALHTVHLLTASLSLTPEEPRYCFYGVEISQTFSALNSCPTIHSLSLTMDHDVPSFMASWMKNVGNTEVQKTAELRHIVHLTVYEGAAVQHLFPTWLSIIFPNLKTFILDDRRAYADRAPFLRQLKEVCPTLDVAFSKNATPKSVARWLEPDDVQD